MHFAPTFRAEIDGIVAEVGRPEGVRAPCRIDLTCPLCLCWECYDLSFFQEERCVSDPITSSLGCHPGRRGDGARQFPAVLRSSGGLGSDSLVDPSGAATTLFMVRGSARFTATESFEQHHSSDLVKGPAVLKQPGRP